MDKKTVRDLDVAGKKVLEGGKLLTFDEEKIYAEAQACAERLVHK